MEPNLIMFQTTELKRSELMPEFQLLQFHMMARLESRQKGYLPAQAEFTFNHIPMEFYEWQVIVRIRFFWVSADFSPHFPQRMTHW